MNPYEGCSFNCQYCYVRGSKYGENMEDTLAVKINGVEVLDRQLAFRVKKNQYGIIALASTDPYIKAEEKWPMTRKFLERILHHRFPVLMITKSDLILRDLDLLREIDQSAIHASDLSGRLTNGAILSFSFSTLDEDIARALEPGAPSPQIRLETMLKCKEAGFTVGVNCIPTLPFISDSDEVLESMIVQAKKYGADYILIGGLTLFGNQPSDSKTLYYKFLERRFSDLIKEYKKLYRIFPMPSKMYTTQLENTVTLLCGKHAIKNSIL